LNIQNGKFSCVENIPFKVASPEYSDWEYAGRKRRVISNVRSGFGIVVSIE
jgi:hypothetical protein